jgi:hypothetical protein
MKGTAGVAIEAGRATIVAQTQSRMPKESFVNDDPLAVAPPGLQQPTKSGRSTCNSKFPAASLIAAASFIALAPPSALAQEAKAAQGIASIANNPFADKISLSFQYDANHYPGPGDKTQQVLTVQPLIPFRVNDDWDVITRSAAPVMVQPALAIGEATARGLGDILVTTFLSPARRAGLGYRAGVSTPQRHEGSARPGQVGRRPQRRRDLVRREMDHRRTHQQRPLGRRRRQPACRQPGADSADDQLQPSP